MCPVDDCSYMDYDPVRCLSHSGCIYCNESQTCRAGNELGQNSGTCTEFITNHTNLFREYPALLYNFDECLLHATSEAIRWCNQSGLCLPINKYTNAPNVGTCDPSFLVASRTGLAAVDSQKTCSYYTEATCVQNAACTWNSTSKHCSPIATPTESSPTKQAPTSDPSPKVHEQSFSAYVNKKLQQRLHNITLPGQTSNTVTPIYANDSTCLKMSCDECVSGTGCVWCVSTQSCVAEWYPLSEIDATEVSDAEAEQYIKDHPNATRKVDNSLRVAYTNCSWLAEGNVYTVTEDDSAVPSLRKQAPLSFYAASEQRCDPCRQFSTCEECAFNPQCGWMLHSSVCVSGRLKPDYAMRGFSSQYEKDEFIAYKLRCPQEKLTEYSVITLYTNLNSIIATVGGAALILAMLL